MRNIKTVSEGMEQFNDAIARHNYKMVGEGDVKTPEGLTVGTVHVAEKSKKNGFAMIYAIENYDGVFVRRGEAWAIDPNRRVEDAMKDALEMLLARREAREAIKRGALH